MLSEPSPQVAAYYESVLYPLQDEVCALVGPERFYLGGGTCLARHYYGHRYSDDLDFFCEGRERSLAAFDADFRGVVNRIADSLPVKVAVEAEYFKRCFVLKGEVALKMEFIYDNSRLIGERRQAGPIRIDSRENIAANKVSAVFGRMQAKDFFDLYFLLKDLELKRVMEWTSHKMAPLDYEGAVLALSGVSLEGEVRMRKIVGQAEFAAFCSSLIKELLIDARSLS